MIIANNSDRQTPQFRVLSESQCNEIYLTTLECLNRVGVQVNNPEARQLLADAGARIVNDRAFIPPHIIQDALVSTPRTFTIYGRDDKYQIRVAPDRVHFGPGPTCTHFIDPQTGERRMPRQGDAGLTARVCDTLENIDYVMGLSLLSDVPYRQEPVYEFAEMISNTTKPVLAWAYEPENVAAIYHIAAAVAGGEEALQKRPNFAFFATFKSPLQHSNEDLANIMWAAEHGIPIIYLGGPTVGLESPVTGASGLVIYLAAALSGLAIVQLKRRGAPVVIGGVPSVIDLRTARPAYGSPEMSLHSAAACELARYLHVPFMGTAGASESKLMDSQAAIELTGQVLMSALSGASFVHDVGFLDCAAIGSLPYLVMADEVISMVKRMLRPIVVNPETIMLDLIEQVGPGGNFISEYRSASICRQEIWVPTLMDRNPHSVWEKKGSLSMEQRTVEKLGAILQNHQPAPLPEAVSQEISSILAGVLPRNDSSR